MVEEFIKSNKSVFEQIRQTDEQGNEYWNSREFAKAIEYSDYRNFLKVVEKAIEACANSGYNSDDHIVEFNDMIEIGKGGKRSAKSLKLTRYACYLIVQNADPTKEVVAQGQTYFAVQTRLQEISGGWGIFSLPYNKQMKKALIYIGLTIVLTIVGFLTGQKFIDISISGLNLINISLSWTTLSGQFKQNLIFTIAIGLLPSLQLVSSKIAKVNSIQNKIITLLTIIFTGVILWQFRIFQLNRLFDKYREFSTVKGIENYYFGENLKFGLYLLVGFLIGTIIITLSFKQFNKRKTKE
jgi:hypothetical protein